MFSFYPPCFKVGEQVKLYWNQRSKEKWFCGYCGKGQTYKMKCGTEICCEERRYHPWTKETYNIMANSTAHGWLAPSNIFNKHLGTAEITEVFKIEMDKVMKGATKGTSIS